MKPCNRDIAVLAAWLQEKTMKHPLSYKGCPPTDYKSLKKAIRDRYKFVATELLVNPPAFMRREAT